MTCWCDVDGAPHSHQHHRNYKPQQYGSVLRAEITPLLLFGRETAFWINSAFNSTRNGKEPMIMLMVMVAHISKSTHVPFMVVESRSVSVCVCG